MAINTEIIGVLVVYFIGFICGFVGCKILDL